MAPMICRTCEGTGRETCPECKGKKYFTLTRVGVPVGKEPCPTCDATGKIKCTNSPPCHGGYIRM